MYTIIRLIIIAISLFSFLNLFLTNYDNNDHAIINKIYIFFFMFIIQFILLFLSTLVFSQNISMNDIIEHSVNNALISVISFDIFNNLVHQKVFDNIDKNKKTLMLVLLIIGFIAIINVVQIIITYNY
jgi:hypothetical protein